MINPVQIERIDQSGLQVKWSDGTLVNLPSELLRRNCPCAECRERRGETNHSKPIGGSKSKSLLSIVQSSTAEELALKRIWGIGGYAIGLEWGDGHASGIYPFGLLRELSTRVGSSAGQTSALRAC